MALLLTRVTQAHLFKAVRSPQGQWESLSPGCQGCRSEQGCELVQHSGMEGLGPVLELGLVLLSQSCSGMGWIGSVGCSARIRACRCRDNRFSLTKADWEVWRVERTWLRWCQQRTQIPCWDRPGLCSFSLTQAAPGVLEVTESNLQQRHNLGLCWPLVLDLEKSLEKTQWDF